MLRTAMFSWVICTLLVGGVLAGEASPKFTKKPTATKAGGKVKIEFAVDRETDVTVGIENAAGKVICHLVSGRLGKNPPTPLKPGLAQSFEWDGKADYGKPAGAGPFRVKVSLGLTPTLDDYLFDDPGAIHGGVNSLGVDRQGRLYVANTPGVWASPLHWAARSSVLRVYERDNKYVKTILPFPSDLPREKLVGTGAFEADGRLNPLWHVIAGMRLLPGTELTWQEIPVTTDGRLIKVVGAFCRGFNQLRILSMDKDGGFPAGKPMLGPLLFPKDVVTYGRFWIALSSDEKHIFLSGSFAKKGDKKHPFNAVYRAPLDGSEGAKVFAGSPAKAGAGKGQFKAPKGVACDGAGRLYVADYGNNRIVILKESDGSFVDSVPLAGPQSLQVHPKTKAIYALAGGGGELVKISGGKNAKEVARLRLGKRAPGGRCHQVMVLDSSAEPPVIWCAGDRYTINGLVRVEDTGAAFGPPRRMESKKFGVGRCDDLTVDRDRDELYIESQAATPVRVSLKTGKVEKLPHLGGGNPEGTTWCLAPGGESIYTFGFFRGLRKWDRSFKPIPFGPKDDGKLVLAKHPGNKSWMRLRATMTFSTRGLGVAPNGNIHLMPRESPEGKDKHPSEVMVFGPDGTRKDPVIWRCSSAAVGPRFDSKGNIYIMECVKDKGKAVPDFFKDRLPPLEKDSVNPRKHPFSAPTKSTVWMYGSVMKFAPSGGAIWWQPQIRPGEPGWTKKPLPEAIGKLPKTVVSALTSVSGRLSDVEVQGALWHYYGASPVVSKVPYGCNCQAGRFDVDEYGRVFFPDVGRFRVGILDTNGNELGFVGRYGNRDEGKEKPLAGPEVPLAYPFQVAVSRTHILIGDLLNQRIAKVKLAYAAEEICDVR